MAKEIIKGYTDEFPSMHSIPKWAQELIHAGIYQQGKADTLVYVFNEMMKKQNPR